VQDDSDLVRCVEEPAGKRHVSRFSTPTSENPLFAITMFVRMCPIITTLKGDPDHLWYLGFTTTFPGADAGGLIIWNFSKSAGEYS
jgi:hypothetical protein